MTTPLAPLTIACHLNEDGSVTVTMIYPGQRVETETLYPDNYKTINPVTGEAEYRAPKAKSAKTAKSTESFDEKLNAKMPKTKRRYLAPNGKWVSYARARQIGCLDK